MPYISTQCYFDLCERAKRGDDVSHRRMLGDLAVELYDGSANKEQIEAFGTIARWVAERERNKPKEVKG